MEGGQAIVTVLAPDPWETLHQPRLPAYGLLYSKASKLFFFKPLLWVFCHSLLNLILANIL